MGYKRVTVTNPLRVDALRRDLHVRDVLPNGETATLLFIIDHQHRHGYSPTYPDMEQALGVARTTVTQRLRVLRRQGLVTWEKGRNGTLRATVRPAELPAPLLLATER